MIAGLLVWARAIFTAFSTASAPELKKAAALGVFPGAKFTSFSASSTRDS